MRDVGGWPIKGGHAECGEALPHFRHEFHQKMNLAQSVCVGVRTVTRPACDVPTRFPGVLWAALLLLVVATAPVGVLAQAEKSTPELRTADEEFSHQLSELKRTFA